MYLSYHISLFISSKSMCVLCASTWAMPLFSYSAVIPRVPNSQLSPFPSITISPLFFNPSIRALPHTPHSSSSPPQFPICSSCPLTIISSVLIISKGHVMEDETCLPYSTNGNYIHNTRTSRISPELITSGLEICDVVSCIKIMGLVLKRLWNFGSLKNGGRASWTTPSDVGMSGSQNNILGCANGIRHDAQLIFLIGHPFPTVAKYRVSFTWRSIISRDLYGMHRIGRYPS